MSEANADKPDAETFDDLGSLIDGGEPVAQNPPSEPAEPYVEPEQQPEPSGYDKRISELTEKQRTTEDARIDAERRAAVAEQERSNLVNWVQQQNAPAAHQPTPDEVNAMDASQYADYLEIRQRQGNEEFARQQQAGIDRQLTQREMTSELKTKFKDFEAGDADRVAGIMANVPPPPGSNTWSPEDAYIAARPDKARTRTAHSSLNAAATASSPSATSTAPTSRAQRSERQKLEHAHWEGEGTAASFDLLGDIVMGE